jgi:hypothetical protein
LLFLWLDGRLFMVVMMMMMIIIIIIIIIVLVYLVPSAKKCEARLIRIM